jgi:hypothetical protein
MAGGKGRLPTVGVRVAPRKNQRYDPEALRLAVAEAPTLGRNAAAKKYGVPKQTVSDHSPGGKYESAVAPPGDEVAEAAELLLRLPLRPSLPEGTPVEPPPGAVLLTSAQQLWVCRQEALEKAEKEAEKAERATERGVKRVAREAEAVATKERVAVRKAAAVVKAAEAAAAKAARAQEKAGRAAAAASVRPSARRPRPPKRPPRPRPRARAHTRRDRAAAALRRWPELGRSEGLASMYRRLARSEGVSIRSEIYGTTPVLTPGSCPARGVASHSVQRAVLICGRNKGTSR